MNYYLFSMIVGIIGVTTIYLYGCINKEKYHKNTYIKLFIYTVLISISSIYLFMNNNNISVDNIRNNLPILRGDPNF